MKIAIAGVSGFLGGALAEVLKARGDEIVPITRDLLSAEASLKLLSAIEGCDAVINLVGGPMFRRWNRSTREQIYRSRVETTARLAAVINATQRAPTLFVSASAIGYYSSSQIFSEHNSAMGSDYLSWLCGRWEEAAEAIKTPTRLVLVRIAPVLARNRGVAPYMQRLLNWHLSLRFGNGRNFFSWIHLSDFISAMLFVIDNDTIRGAVNISAPGVTTNGYMSSLFAKMMHRRTLRIPPFMMRAVMGEAVSVIMGSKAVYPAVLIEHGFHFQYPYIRAALENISKK